MKVEKLMIFKIPFHLIRHGQTDWNVERRIMRILDIPLNCYGEMEFKNGLKQMQCLNIETICYSPLKKAKQTAEILNEALRCEMIPIEELKEFDVGAYGGNICGDWFNAWRNGALLPDGALGSFFSPSSLEKRWSCFLPILGK